MKEILYLIKRAIFFMPVVSPLESGNAWNMTNDQLKKAGLPIIRNSKVYFLTGFFSLLTLFSYGQATIVSVQGGLWTAKTTWDCGCIPTSSDNVVISSGHKVSLGTNTVVNDLLIKSGSLLYNNKRQITITGDYIVDGDHVSMGGIVTALTGINTSIGGIGTIHEDDLAIMNGNKTIVASSNLTKAFGTITIYPGVTVTNKGIITVGGDIIGQSASAIWINASNSTLNIRGILLATGKLNASATGNNIRYYGAVSQNIKTALGNNYYNLILESSGIKNLMANIFINGDLILNSGPFYSNSNTIYLRGNWVNTGSFNEASGTVVFDGNSDQVVKCLFGQSYYNLRVEKLSGKVSLGCTDTVKNLLTMNSGDIDVGSGKLVLGTDTINDGTLIHISGNIIGKFERWIKSPLVTYQFPIGTSTDSRETSIGFSSMSSGSIIVEFIEFAPGNNGLPVVDGTDTLNNTFSEGYWEVTPMNSFVGNNYNVALGGFGFSSFPIDSSTKVLFRPSSSDPWSANGSHGTVLAPFVSRIGLTTIGQLTFGDTSNCAGPSTSMITGIDSTCKNSLGIPYSVTNTLGSTYAWTVSGGTIVSGQGTNNITVDWGGIGMIGEVEVVESNNCTNGSPVNLPVSIHPFTTSSITGKENVTENTTGEVYSISGITGYTYDWTVMLGTIVSGQGSNSITVDWGAAGTGKVIVDGSNGCGTADTISLNVNIYVPINSVKSGEWNDVSTWNCKCVPSASSNVRVMKKHKIKLKAATVVNHLEIVAGGEIDDEGKTMDVKGDLTVDGEYSGSATLTLSGSGTIIDGIGKITNKGNLEITDGDKTILSSAYLTKTRKMIIIKDAYTITNYGNILLYGDIIGTNVNSIWINEVNSSVNIKGAFLLTGKLIASASGNLVNYSGSGTQSVKQPNANTYYRLSVDKPGNDLTLTSDINTTELNLSSGNLVLDNNNLTIKDQGNITGGSSLSYIEADGSGYVIKEFSDTGVFTFPIGDITNYSPFTFDLNSATFFGGDGVAIKVIDAKHPTITSADYISRYWTMTWSGLLSMNFDVSYTYVSGDIVGTEIGMITYVWDGSSWTIHDVVDEVTNTFQTSGGISAPFPGILQFTGGSGSPLPIELLTFDAEVNEQAVDVAWTTATEINNDYFIVERSQDGMDFYGIGMVFGVGNSYVPSNYALTDNHPLQGTSYYRLMQVDKDGRASYSDVVAVTLSDIPVPMVKVYPNPVVDGKLNLGILGFQNKEMLVILLDHLGREVFTRMMLVESDNILTGIDVGSKLPSGVYFVISSSDNYIFKQKVILTNSYSEDIFVGNK